MRGQIVLLWGEGEVWFEIAKGVGCSMSWVGGVIRRFGDHGIAGLYDRREENGQKRKDLHAAVTGNHQCSTIEELMSNVQRWPLTTNSTNGNICR